MNRAALVCSVALVAIAACASPTITHCGDIDCPKDEVCDGMGGCALPSQIESCNGTAACGPCTYNDRANNPIQGACLNGVCRPVLCGDGIVGCGEVCDSGADNNSCTTCSADCKSNLTCGNGIVDLCKGEQCDAAGSNSDTPNAPCRTDCSQPRCGDGIVDDTLLHEACDAGSMNADTPNAPCRSNCTAPRCGDGIVDNLLGEVCDDGNNVSGDGCSGDCKSTEVCGNHYTDIAVGEQCDDGVPSTSPYCHDNCKIPVCGDGITDPVFNEQCDDGANNSNAPNAACRTNCQLPKCGDGVADTALGEVCDVGAMNDLCTTCSPDCKSDLTCGNGIVDSCKGEQCDAGASNSNLPNAPCRANCTLPRCGDGVLDTTLGEQCDAGANNSNAPNAPCRTNCQLPRCGDQIVDNGMLGEVCDAGAANTLCTTCSADCKSNLTCGNGIVDLCKGEQCDAGGMNANTPNAPCRTTCKLPKCGDGITDTALGEQCDAGAANANTPNAPCRTNCQLPRCGDGIADTSMGEVCDLGANNNACTTCSVDCKSNLTCGNGIVDLCKGEQCDAGANNSNNPNAPCRPGCQLPRCGDGIVDTALGEQCDAGASNSNNPNAPCRTDCQLPRCGDGIVDTAMGEKCDAGAANTLCTVCSADCKSDLTCGNGVVDTCKGEQCDAGGSNANTPNAPCRTSCQLPKCGDGIVDDTLLGEQCDQGVANSNSPDASCRTNCQPQRCGDGIKDTLHGEVCDAGTTVNNQCTVCAADCKSDLTCGNGVVDSCKSEQCDDGNKRSRDGCSACKSEDAIYLLPGSSPANRRDAGIAYDGARQRVVLFGGYNGSYLADTWEWDGVSWTEMQPRTQPGAREGEGLAYDAARHRIVLFGGVGNSGNLADTWEWDGVTWTQLAPATAPSARSYLAMGYDANLKHVMLYGGNTGTAGAPVANAETWTWNGTTWTKLTPATSPGARYGGSLAFDSAHKYSLMYGGQLDKHVWTFDGTNWTDRGLQTTDLALHMALAYDANRGAMVLWHAAGTTWEWNGTTFAAVAAATATARDGTAMTYDAIRKQLVLFGGYTVSGTTTTYLGDTWLRAGTVWSAAPAWLEPPARMRGAVAYDPVRGVSVLFGGMTTDFATDANRLADTWEFDGRGWTQKSPGKPAALVARAGCAAGYDVATRSVMLFGGDSYNTTTSTRTSYSDLYSYNGTAWSVPANSGGRADNPQNPNLAYDEARDRVLTFGGNGVNATYVWSAGAGWVLQNPVARPSARYHIGIANDPVRGKLVLYGGHDSSTLANDSDTWEWDGTNWTRVTTVGPGGRRGHELVYDPDAQHVIVFGASNQGTEDLWEWNGNAWGSRSFPDPPPERILQSAAYDAARHDLVVFGGRSTGFTILGGTEVVRYRANLTPEACTSAQVDYDNDGLSGCADDECWSVCDPLHPPGTARPASAPYCGDGTCNGIEDCRICPQDCGTGSPKACTGTCGDFNCDSGETTATCPNDC
jgi:cysteine-rich repeat protein